LHSGKYSTFPNIDATDEGIQENIVKLAVESGVE
jgi:hypothetical protein